MRLVLSLLGAGLLALGACSMPAPQAKTADEIRDAIAAYERGDESATEDRLKALFARLDAEVALLVAKEAETPPASRAEVTEQRKALEEERRSLQVAYAKARLARLGTEAGKALKGVGEQIGQGIEDAGRRMREAMQKDEPPVPAQ